MRILVKFAVIGGLATAFSMLDGLEFSKEEWTFKKLANGEQVSEMSVITSKAHASTDFDETIREWNSEESSGGTNPPTPPTPPTHWESGTTEEASYEEESNNEEREGHQSPSEMINEINEVHREAENPLPPAPESPSEMINEINELHRENGIG